MYLLIKHKVKTNYYFIIEIIFNLFQTPCIIYFDDLKRVYLKKNFRLMFKIYKRICKIGFL